jgi:hypothetical protein
VLGHLLLERLDVATAGIPIGVRRPGVRAQRRELQAEPVAHQLVHDRRRLDVGQGGSSEADRLGARDEPGRLAHEQLAAVPGSAQQPRSRATV